MSPRTGPDAGAGDAIVFLGHATTLITVAGVRLLTDPVVRDRVAHLRRQVPPPDAAHLRDLDVVLVSHAHHDHLDLPSLRRVARDTPVVVPRGVGRTLRRHGIAVAAELEAGERLHVGRAAVLAVHAEHDGRRHPGGRRFPALGYVVEGTSRVYFAGDTDLFGGMAVLRSLDAALLPVSGWGRRVGPGHLDPERAAEAVARMRPRVAVPIHWGTLASPTVAGADLGAPAREFARLVARTTPEVAVAVLDPGGRLELTAQRIRAAAP